MDLRSGHPYWRLKNGLLESYPSLGQDESCDVAIIGGGIKGALTAFHLTHEGVATLLLDNRDVATGSTAASTSMLQYAADRELIDSPDASASPAPSASIVSGSKPSGKSKRSCTSSVTIAPSSAEKAST